MLLPRQPRDLQLCNPGVPIPRVVPRRFNRFKLTAEWKRKCSSLPHPSSAAGNWCWEYMKHNGCYASHGSTTWYEDQSKARSLLTVAQLGQAPPPAELAMEALVHPHLCENPLFGKDWRTPFESSASLSWMRATVSVYVVHLRSATDRWRLVSSRLKELGIDFQTVEGVDLTRLDDYQRALQEGLLPKVANGSLGTLGCAAAHFRAMRTAARGPKALALVLEDDVWLSDDFAAKLRQLVHDEAPCNWQILSLKSRCPFGMCVSTHLSQVRPDGNSGRCSGVNFGLFAMLYRVNSLENIWKMLYEEVWSQQCHNTDVALAGISDKVAYYAVPAVQMPGLLHEARLPSLREARNSMSFPNSM
ncbi:unnamed protein product [Symbiodinium sp. CCMP2592]|nr:unnamed protein product [Symbiodinium sp. CCMP2592]